MLPAWTAAPQSEQLAAKAVLAAARDRVERLDRVPEMLGGLVERRLLESPPAGALPARRGFPQLAGRLPVEGDALGLGFPGLCGHARTAARQHGREGPGACADEAVVGRLL